MTETTATSVTLIWDSGNPEPVSFFMIQYRAKATDAGFQEVCSNGSLGYNIPVTFPKFPGFSEILVGEFQMSCFSLLILGKLTNPGFLENMGILGQLLELCNPKHG